VKVSHDHVLLIRICNNLMHMWHHVTNHLIISNDKDSNSETTEKLCVRDNAHRHNTKCTTCGNIDHKAKHCSKRVIGKGEDQVEEPSPFAQALNPGDVTPGSYHAPGKEQLVPDFMHQVQKGRPQAHRVGVPTL
jgi:hypothetical protein